MHSKWQLWDFFSSFDRSTLGSFNGVLALNTFDPTSLRMVKDHLLKGAGERVIHHRMASDVDRNWIETEFQTLSFFDGSDCFFVHQAQDLKADLLEHLTSLNLDNRFLLLSFETEGTAWKKVVKEGKASTLQIEAPRFWEQNKLLDFACAYLRLPLTFEAKAWMIDSLENNLSAFYNASCLIKLNHPEAKEVSLAEVKLLLTPERMDQFALASLFARRKPRQFFDRVVSLEGDFDKMRGLFNFMQSHLIKLADVSYLADKPRLTQYDKDLQGSSKLWKEPELMEAIACFNRWEILSKRKDPLLWHELRGAHLRN